MHATAPTCALVLCRAAFGDYFGITVAGYPEAHPDVVSEDPAEMEQAYQKDLAYLKEKVCPHGKSLLRHTSRKLPVLSGWWAASSHTDTPLSQWAAF